MNVSERSIRRAWLAASAAVGAGAIFAPGAQAADFTVDVLADGPADACDPGACKLRDAIALANGNGASEDRITFAVGLSGQIVLTQGELEITGPDITIDGPGRDVISVSGDADGNGLDEGDFRVFTISGDRAAIDGLTLTEGRGTSDGSTAGPGGAVRVNAGAELAVLDSAITGSQSTDGGGAYAAGLLVLDGTEVSGNSAGTGAGLSSESDDEGRGELLVTGSQIAGNTASNDGGGILADGPLTVEESTISGNTAADIGGGIYSTGKYGTLDVADSVISGNDADYGGGVGISPAFGKYNVLDRFISRTTIVENTAEFAGGGVYATGLNPGDELTISRSTLSGNTAEGTAEADGVGGGLAVNTADYSAVEGDLLVSNSTVSGNTADVGGGVSIGGTDPEGSGRVYGGSVELANSTVAANAATLRGGGIYLASYSAGEETTQSSIPRLTSTIVADNTAAGAAQDLDQAEGSDGGGFDSAFSLVETPGDAPILQETGDANVIGSDPQLGALGDNGGPTQTHVPATTSPAIDKGDAVPRDDTDQRGAQRTQDGTGIPNPEGGDGTDIGAVEIDRVQATPQEQPPAQPPGTQPPGAQPPGTQPPPPNVIVRRFPSGLTLRTTPRRDLTAPYRFRSTGRIVPPAGMSGAEACRTIGIVTVQVKRNGTTISNRRAVLKPDCTYESVVTFRFRQRFGRARNLKFTARFGGNQQLEPITSRSVLRRVQ